MANSARWIKISKDEAKKHELYGAGGWLLVFAFALLLALLAQLGQARSLAREAGMGLSELLGLDLPIVGFLKLTVGAQLLQTVAVYWMLAAKPTIFRQATTWFLVATGPLVLALQLVGSFPGTGSIAAEEMLPWVLASMVWVVYLNQSRRVRVTFEHQVRTDNTTNVDAPPSSHGGPRELTATQPSNNSTSTNLVSLTQDLAANDRPWAQALAEFDGPERRPGLWARSFVQAQGDETKAKVFYLATRAEEIALDGKAEFQLPQEGTCPNCATTLMLSASECPHCKAAFGAGASWAPIPLGSSGA